MIYFRNYEYGDLRKIINKDDFELMGFMQMDESIIDHDLSWTLCNDKIVLGCAGFKKMWNGVYECWLHPAVPEIFYHFKILIIKKIKYEFKRINFHRMQATVKTSTKNHEKLMLCLGFYYESTLIRYGPDKMDYIMYTIIR